MPTPTPAQGAPSRAVPVVLSPLTTGRELRGGGTFPPLSPPPRRRPETGTPPLPTRSPTSPRPRRSLCGHRHGRGRQRPAAVAVAADGSGGGRQELPPPRRDRRRRSGSRNGGGGGGGRTRQGRPPLPPGAVIDAHTPGAGDGGCGDGGHDWRVRGGRTRGKGSILTKCLGTHSRVLPGGRSESARDVGAKEDADAVAHTSSLPLPQQMPRACKSGPREARGGDGGAGLATTPPTRQGAPPAQQGTFPTPRRWSAWPPTPDPTEAHRLQEAEGAVHRHHGNQGAVPPRLLPVRAPSPSF